MQATFKLPSQSDQHAFGTAPITLYTFVMSPYAAKVHSCLNFKGLNFQCFYVNPLKMKKQLPVGHQVPVLTIGNESRADSTPIALWLDEMFPNTPRLVPIEPNDRQKVLELDQWVSHSVIPHLFRMTQEPGFNLGRVLNAWRLGYVMRQTAHGGIPAILNAFWPVVLGSVKFLDQARAMADLGTKPKQARAKLYQECVRKIDGGPFLGGRETPSLADLAAYPQFILPYCAGLYQVDGFKAYPEILQWLNNVREYLDYRPSFIPKVAMKRAHP